MKSKIGVLTLITILSVLISCAKKELKNPTIVSEPEDSSYLSVAPCASELINNRITSSTYTSGYNTFYFKPYVDESFTYWDIECSHYASGNTFKISIPYYSGFLGKKTYTLFSGTSDPYGNHAKLMHSLSSSFYFVAQEGNLYAKYTNTQLELMFCNVTVIEPGGSYSHVLNGKVTIDL
jgi:hypothetical protein